MNAFSSRKMENCRGQQGRSLTRNLVPILDYTQAQAATRWQWAGRSHYLRLGPCIDGHLAGPCADSESISKKPAAATVDRNAGKNIKLESKAGGRPTADSGS